jgi:hypothetical protein
LDQQEDLLQWATDNMRVLYFEKYSRELFLKSPRELSSDEEKDFVYSLSSTIKVHDRRGQIDYFISHSWSDNSAEKCQVTNGSNLNTLISNS